MHSLRFILLFIVIQFSIYSFAQSDSVVYFLDKDEKLCLKEKAVYLVRGNTEKEKFKLSYFVITTGDLVMETTYTDYTMAIKDGLFTLYEEESHKILKKGYYANNLENGYWIYQNNGYLTDSLLYEDGRDIMKISFSYYESGNLYTRVLNDVRTKTKEFTKWNEDGSLNQHYKFINGMGNWTRFYPNGQLKEVEYQTNGKKDSSNYYTETGILTTESEAAAFKKKEAAEFEKQISDLKIKTAGNTPVYPGGSSALRAYVLNNLRITSQSNERNPFDRVENISVIFYLDKNGRAENITIQGGSNSALQNQLFRIFRNMPAWDMKGQTKYGPVPYSINLNVVGG